MHERENIHHTLIERHKRPNESYSIFEAFVATVQLYTKERSIAWIRRRKWMDTSTCSKTCLSSSNPTPAV